jgi:hypothetical protein
MTYENPVGFGVTEHLPENAANAHDRRRHATTHASRSGKQGKGNDFRNQFVAEEQTPAGSSNPKMLCLRFSLDIGIFLVLN